MELLLLFGCIGLVIWLLAYFLIQRKREAESKKQFATTAAELKKLRENEYHSHDELAMLQHKLQHALEDPVTHLSSWQLFEDRLQQGIKESARYQFVMGLLFVDIDEFHVINAGLGHALGDVLLVEVASRLQTCIRQVDSMSRHGKDTFAVLLTQLAKPETAAVVAQRMLLALAEPFQIEDHELYITACVGIAIYPADGGDAASLLRNTDQALRLAKRSGKHVYQFYQEKIHINSQRELTLHNSLRRDSVLQEFVTYYQPIVNIEDETIFCMDAELHWTHPTLGLIGPQELLGQANKQHKLNLVSECLLKNACRQFLHWRSLGFNPSYLGISISVRQLENSHFIYRLSQILQETQFNPEWLLLEIKEMMLPAPVEGLEKAFNMLKYLGVKLAISNFGAGSFSLLHLKQLPVDYLQLDAGLISDIEDNQRAINLLEALTLMTTKLSMQLIIQGVDSDQKMEVVKKLGCRFLQGKKIGTPLSEQEVEAKMV